MGSRNVGKNKHNNQSGKEPQHTHETILFIYFNSMNYARFVGNVSTTKLTDKRHSGQYV